MTSRSKKRLNELVSEEYIREDCSELQPHHALEDINNPQHLIITFSASILVSPDLVWGH